MTGIAVANTAGIMRPAAAGEGRGGMTGRAIEAGRNVRRHGIRLAGRRISVMARRAIAGDAGVIESRRFEAVRVMAYTAILISRDMTGFLGCRETGAMTGRAVIHDTRVTKARRFKAGGLMAVDAITVGRHMEVAFADSRITIMTGDAVVDDALVFKVGVGERCWRMAYRAILGDGDVPRVSFGIGAGCIDTIVAGRTVINDTGVIEYCRCKGSAGHVTDAAILGSWHVRWIDLRTFASSGDTIVAGVAAGGQHGGIGMVDIRVAKISRVMTESAILSSRRMWRCGRLAAGTQASKAAIVAGHTITGDSLVGQHRGWFKPGHRMAGITILASRYMTGCLHE